MVKTLNNLEVISQIKRENLDEKNYLKTLIEEALINEMITDDDIVKIQIEIIQLLDERIYKYNGLSNGSIRKEIMEDINCSNYYTIGLQLKTLKNPDEAVKEIKEKGLKEIYYRGRKRIDRILDIIKVIYIKVKQNKLETENHTYNATITGGIRGFLKIYDPDFKAQDMKITADYPLYNNLIGNLEGLEFIKEYINSIYLENEFCNMFSNKKIEHLLYGYSTGYKNLIINIFEIVFLEVIACKLVKRNIYDLVIDKFELDKIYKLFKSKDKISIDKIIRNVNKEICSELIEEKKDLQKYIEKNLSYIIEIITNAVRQNTLDKVFITQKKPELKYLIY